MANPEHLEKLQGGAEVWNCWRKDNPEIEVDLSGAEFIHHQSSMRDLSGLDLSHANLIRAKFTKISLESANLHRARMSEIDLDRVDLRRADLSGASLVDATLVKADLRGAILRRTNLGDAYLRDAKLEGADLNEAYLSGAHLAGADFTGANLSMAEFSDADLRRAKLVGAKMTQVVLIRADLTEASLNDANLSVAVMNHSNLTRALLENANLGEADLRSANMRAARLSGASLDRADLRSANLQFAILDDCSADRIKLWETQRAGWSLKGIRCERAYWDKDAVQPTVYSPGEFESIYAEFTSIEFFYQGGVSTFELSTLPAMLHHLAALHEGVNIRLKSIEETGGGAKISISVGDADLETTQKIKADATRVFQSQLALRDDQITRLRIEKEYLETFVSEKLIHKMLAAAPHNTFNAPVYGAGFSSGDSHLSIQQTFHDNAALQAVLEKLLANHSELGLPAAETFRLEDEIHSATAELGNKNPDPSIIVRGVRFAQEIVKEALKKGAGKLAEEAASADWHSWLRQLHSVSQHLNF